MCYVGYLSNELCHTFYWLVALSENRWSSERGSFLAQCTGPCGPAGSVLFWLRSAVYAVNGSQQKIACSQRQMHTSPYIDTLVMLAI